MPASGYTGVTNFLSNMQYRAFGAVITYGEVPLGWRQDLPKREPPKLLDGAVYAISVLTTKNHTAGLLFKMQNGKAVECKPWWKDKSNTY